jgi:hypothetical protein
MRHWSWAQRLLLAELTRDTDGARLVADEIGNCPHCWRLVARYAVRLAANGWFHADDEGAIVESLQSGIGYALDQLEDTA